MPTVPSERSRVVAAAFMIQCIIIGLMFGYGVFFKVLEEEMGWSRTLLSSASSIAFLVMGIFAFGAGRLSDRFGPRWVLTATGIATGVGYLLMSSMQAPWQLLLYFGLLIGLGLATHDVVTLSTVSSWYERKRGLMTGIVKTGTACGQIIVPLLVTWLVVVRGWREALFILGIVAMVLLTIIAQFLKRKPVEQVVSRGSGGNQENEQPERAGLTLKEARAGRTLWTLCAIQFCFLPSLVTVPLHMVAHATDLGMTTARAASILSLLGGASIVGRLMVGHLVDRIGARLGVCICLASLSVALLTLRLVDVPSLLYLVALIYGAAHGGLFTVGSPAVAEYFGMKSHGEIFGTVVFFGTLSGAGGPLLAGMLFDRFQSYDLAFTILAVLAFIGLMLAWSLPKLLPKRTA